MSKPTDLDLDEFLGLVRDVEAASKLAFNHLRSLGHDSECTALLVAVIVCKVARASKQSISEVMFHVTSMAEAIIAVDETVQRRL